MRFYLIILIFLLSFNIFSAEKELGIQVPGVRIEDNHFKSTASIQQVIKFFRKHGVSKVTKTGFDAPHVKVVNLKSKNIKTKWESINIYNDSRYTYIYVIPRK